jgi:cytochrome c oxidase subunit 2
MTKLGGLIAVLLFALSQPARMASAQDSVPPSPPHVIELIAKTFEFAPNEVHVKAGERVRIKLHSADRAHGLKLSLYPEGASEDGAPGLVFEHPQDEAKVDKHHDRVIEFLAARPGTYDFKCSVQCSMGHGHDRMTGKLIVDE